MYLPHHMRSRQLKAIPTDKLYTYRAPFARSIETPVDMLLLISPIKYQCLYLVFHLL